MADSGFGGYNDTTSWLDFGSTEQQNEQFLTPRQRISLNPNYSQDTRFGILSRLQAEENREAKEAQDRENSLAAKEAKAEAQQEGDIAFGSIGKNRDRDSRAAQVLLALGIQEDLMKAIIAASRVSPDHNR